jgi:DNA-binding MarR family transcriptional regulator
LQSTTMSSVRVPTKVGLEEEAIVSSIVGIGKLLSAEFRKIAAENNLSDCLAGTLWHVHRFGPTKASELARSMACDMGNLSGSLDRLESTGLVERVQSGADRRVRLLQLTAKGRKIAEHMEARFKKTAIHDELSRMSARERYALSAMLNKVFTGLSSTSGRKAGAPTSQLRRVPA